MFNSKFKIQNSKLQAGFTLIELIVAMSVFIIAITIAVGGFVRALRTQRMANQMLSVNSNASLAIEQMAREIRTGYNFGLNNIAPGNCPAGQKEELAFTNSRANSVFYRGENGAVLRKECSGTDCSASSFEPLTASNVKLEKLCFVNTGNLDSGKDPWRITFFMKIGSANPGIVGESLDFQTTVAARILPQELPPTP
ncbi:MAG TPA: type II secretion system protein [Candidatus Paceibacterota bacterium]|nr:type II secretion system protein [Candidatus Paceibacterota bacterium]